MQIFADDQGTIGLISREPSDLCCLRNAAAFLLVFFVRPGCELERFAAEGSPADAALKRLREEANEPAYDDDLVRNEVVFEDGLFDGDDPLGWDSEDDLPDDVLSED